MPFYTIAEVRSAIAEVRGQIAEVKISRWPGFTSAI
jgi:hypothetical protein